MMHFWFSQKYDICALWFLYLIISFSFQKIKDKEYVETILKKGLNDKITSIFPALKDNKMAQNNLCNRILECIEISEPVNIFIFFIN